MSLYKDLEKLFQPISLDFCDSMGKLLIDSPLMASISKIIPEWSDIILEGLTSNKPEAYRTIRHIFRSLWVYFAIMNERFEINIEKKLLKAFRKVLENIFQFNPDIFCLILLFHDIGRPFNKEWHTLESAKILQKKNLLANYHLSPEHQKLINGIIKHHLLPGTIFTGESSYYGASALYLDEDLQFLWQLDDLVEIFFRSLMAFTIIDIWGYDYSRIYNHYFSSYQKICNHLTYTFLKLNCLEFKEGLDLLYQELSRFDEKNLKWRIACALRIFQFVNTAPNLTEDFFSAKIDTALNCIGLSWESFKISLENTHSVIQFQYALPIMMILASGEFKRSPISNNDKVRPELFRFWQSCAHLIGSNYKKSGTITQTPPQICNIIFQLPHGWFIEPKYMNLIQNNSFFTILEHSVLYFNQEMKCNQIMVNLMI